MNEGEIYVKMIKVIKVMAISTSEKGSRKNTPIQKKNNFF